MRFINRSQVKYGGKGYERRSHCKCTSWEEEKSVEGAVFKKKDKNWSTVGL